MVVDTSALVAVLLADSGYESLLTVLADEDDPVISAATLVEASIVMHTKTGDEGVADLDELLAVSGVRYVAVDRAQAHLAREAFARFGKGRAPAGLNYGDCFSYALAKAAGRTLLFKGSDFSQTDITPACR